MAYKINQVHTACLYLLALIVRILVSLTMPGSHTSFMDQGFYF